MYTGTNGNNGSAQPVDLHVHEIIRSAEHELQELMQRRAEVMKRIGTLKQTLAGLANLFGDSVLSDELLTLLDRKAPSRQPGFTKACRLILMDARTPLGARQACAELARRFPDLLERHKDPIASVTTVLNRLVDYAEAHCSLNENGRRVWEWIAERGDPAARLLLGTDTRFGRQQDTEKKQ